MEIITEDMKHGFTLKKEECVPLELKLNVSSKGRVWSHIGTILFEFGTGQPTALTKIVVTNDQYEFLLQLMAKRDWSDCRGL